MLLTTPPYFPEDLQREFVHAVVAFGHPRTGLKIRTINKFWMNAFDEKIKLPEFTRTLSIFERHFTFKPDTIKDYAVLFGKQWNKYQKILEMTNPTFIHNDEPPSKKRRIHQGVSSTHKSPRGSNKPVVSYFSNVKCFLVTYSGVKYCISPILFNGNQTSWVNHLGIPNPIKFWVCIKRTQYTGFPLGHLRTNYGVFNPEFEGNVGGYFYQNVHYYIDSKKKPQRKLAIEEFRLKIIDDPATQNSIYHWGNPDVTQSWNWNLFDDSYHNMKIFEFAYDLMWDLGFKSPFTVYAIDSRNQPLPEISTLKTAADVVLYFRSKIVETLSHPQINMALEREREDYLRTRMNLIQILYLKNKYLR